MNPVMDPFRPRPQIAPHLYQDHCLLSRVRIHPSDQCKFVRPPSRLISDAADIVEVCLNV